MRRFVIPRLHRVILYRLKKINDSKKRRKNWSITVNNNKIYIIHFLSDFFTVLKQFNLNISNYLKHVYGKLLFLYYSKFYNNIIKETLVVF